MIRHGFRFGTNLISHGDPVQIREQVRQAEDCGVDVVVVPDHLGVGAPFPVMLAAASASTSIRVGSFVLTTGFYSPRLLARDIATIDRLTGGRRCAAPVAAPRYPWSAQHGQPPAAPFVTEPH